MIKAAITITLKPGVLDAEGETIKSALARLGYTDVAQIRQGKHIEITLNETDPKRARDKIKTMCAELLVNPVMENYTLSLDTDAK